MVKINWGLAANIIQLKQLWDEGKTASEIGAIMEVSRNAVIGKVHRLKLSRRVDTWPRKLKTNLQQRTRPSSQSLFQRVPTVPSLRPLRPLPPRNLAKPISGKVTIVELTGCKYATDFADGKHLFCNAATEGKSPYCAFHHDRVRNLQANYA